LAMASSTVHLVPDAPVPILQARIVRTPDKSARIDAAIAIARTEISEDGCRK
jgi:hypothetical protein